MKKLIMILIFSTALTGLSIGQNATSAYKDVRMFLDFARFRYNDTHTYLEIYYMLYDLQRDGIGSEKNFNLKFELNDIDADTSLANLDLSVKVGGTNEDRIKGSIIKTELPKGKYKIKMTKIDPNTNVALDSLIREFSTPSYEDKSKIAISDIELCTDIITGNTNTKSPFFKNNMEVIPNAMRMYNEETGKLYYYLELYNFKSNVPDALAEIEVAIADTDGKIVGNKRFKKSRRLDKTPIVGSFDVSEFRNGLYTLIFAVQDREAEYSVYTRANFYVMKPGEVDDQLLTLFPSSEFSTMTLKELDDRFEQAEYIATKTEKEIYSNLDTVEGKRMFLFRFWLEREQDRPGLRHEYYQRVNYANENFEASNLAGWQTDRGRIYIVYGEPSQVERQPNNRETRPFTVWHYHELDGGARFLFVDQTGFGYYLLVSSTLRGEIYDPALDELMMYEQFNDY